MKEKHLKTMQEAKFYTISGKVVDMESFKKMTVGQIFEQISPSDYYKQLSPEYSDGFTPITHRGFTFRYKPRIAYARDHVATIQTLVACRSADIYQEIGYATFNINLKYIEMLGKIASHINEDWTLENCFDVMIMYIPTQL